MTRGDTMRRRLRQAAGLILSFLLAGCVVAPPPGAAPQMALAPVAFADLPGWAQDDSAAALAAFERSCARLAVMPADQRLGGDGLAETRGGRAENWRALCEQARHLPPGDQNVARHFFEAGFQPYLVQETGSVQETGTTAALYTGYYEPALRGARSPGGAFQTPLLGRPLDLVTADLGEFAADLKGRHLAGRVANGRLVPYPTRAEIDAGALAGQRLALLWVSSPIDAFFLQIQGSGRIEMADGTLVRVAYAGQNGRPYVPIGRVLVARGEITADQISEQTIRAWLNTHPKQAQAVMEENPDYVFFRELRDYPADLGPPGTLGAPLTPERSLAVDRRFIPLGAPVFIATTDPLSQAPLQRLMVAQDLGGAITGPLRADIFFGWGKEAAERAGRMNARGAEYLLLPRGN
jgi:membrane-bound lytic murein transglycosylase A